ncbi:Uncharacterised protein [uncultured archaeon]|nr:Uncharacterised protein [uncultured archaeon]
MQKAQISLDLLLALLTAIVLVTSFGYVITNEKQTQDELLIKQQLSTIVENTSNLITAAQAVSDMNFTMQYRLQRINYLDENKNSKSVYPILKIVDQNKLNGKIIAAGKVFDYNSYFGYSKRIVIDVTSVETTGIMVIRNA